jgi:hypothetical protein
LPAAFLAAPKPLGLATKNTKGHEKPEWLRRRRDRSKALKDDPARCRSQDAFVPVRVFRGHNKGRPKPPLTPQARSLRALKDNPACGAATPAFRALSCFSWPKK